MKAEQIRNLKTFDPAEYLNTDEAIAAFLEDAIESGDNRVFQEALSIAARARGMAEIAKAAGLGRESLYKALRPDANPRFDTVQRVLAALGVRLSVSAAP
ncbi:addiction module antidote protein [Dyella caseinilytica]|uniref:Addiction module antidote protein n=1 Tax=Dyella caseinilytica TaxID=1849581 RepID=A0ABX7GPT2_9GAMM|nr:addiction module antidote protein [Dyella caseinilytica]QRN52319.1 putative addiction module antidote protein [Dyella caseinilytica]GGA14802.1 transcriptional regulator [Dyella caseinilytica]